MKSIILISIFFFSFSCKQNDNFFPDKKTVLITDYSNFDNFFPIATLDLSSKGVKDKIHVMYVSFDPDIDHNKAFPYKDCIDEFTFTITENGLYKPTFDKSALTIGKDFEKYFQEGQEKYLNSKAKNKTSTVIEIIDKPDWWQNDQTPLNSKGQKMKFICQVDIYEIFNDDCRLYVFYDQSDRQVKYIYQRT
ncbi:hypothetical protein D3C87_1262690 [compost metagenome]|jgi:hypothetical protein